MVTPNGFSVASCGRSLARCYPLALIILLLIPVSVAGWNSASSGVHENAQAQLADEPFTAPPSFWRTFWDKLTAHWSEIHPQIWPACANFTRRAVSAIYGVTPVNNEDEAIALWFLFTVMVLYIVLYPTVMAALFVLVFCHALAVFIGNWFFYLTVSYAYRIPEVWASYEGFPFRSHPRPVAECAYYAADKTRDWASGQFGKFSPYASMTAEAIKEETASWARYAKAQAGMFVSQAPERPNPFSVIVAGMDVLLWVLAGIRDFFLGSLFWPIRLVGWFVGFLVELALLPLTLSLQFATAHPVVVAAGASAALVTTATVFVLWAVFSFWWWRFLWRVTVGRVDFAYIAGKLWARSCRPSAEQPFNGELALDVGAEAVRASTVFLSDTVRHLPRDETAFLVMAGSQDDIDARFQRDTAVANMAYNALLAAAPAGAPPPMVPPHLIPIDLMGRGGELSRLAVSLSTSAAVPLGGRNRYGGNLAHEVVVMLPDTIGAVAAGVEHAPLDPPRGYVSACANAATKLPDFWAAVYRRFLTTRYGGIIRREPTPSDLAAARAALVTMVEDLHVRPSHAAEWLPRLWALIDTEHGSHFEWARLLKSSR